MKEITTTELKQLIASGEKLVIVDTRTQQEYIEFHLPGAKLIPYDEIDSRHGELEAPKDAKIVLICRSGARSEIATKKMEQLGYNNVVNVKGGLLDWDNGSD